MNNQINKLFPSKIDQVLVTATISGLITIHETIVEGAAVFSQFTASILQNEGKYNAFAEKMNEAEISIKIFNNIDSQINIRESFSNELENGELTRYDFDLFVMNLFSNILEIDTLNQSAVDLVNENFAFEVTPHFEANEMDDFFKILDANVHAAKTMVSIYGEMN
jgi:hypothetical protein